MRKYSYRLQITIKNYTYISNITHGFYNGFFSEFQPAYMGMDADGMDYPNGSELGEIFAALESLKQELQVSIGYTI